VIGHITVRGFVELSMPEDHQAIPPESKQATSDERVAKWTWLQREKTRYIEIIKQRL
jgi:hypothetical protein